MKEQTKKKQTQRYREQLDIHQIGGRRLGEGVEKVKRIKKYKLPIIKIVMGCKLLHIVNNILVMMLDGY